MMITVIASWKATPLSEKEMNHQTVKEKMVIMSWLNGLKRILKKTRKGSMNNPARQRGMLVSHWSCYG